MSLLKRSSSITKQSPVILSMAGLLVIIFTAYIMAQSSTICRVESNPNTCINTLDGQTVVVDDNNLLFGSKLTFCPDTVLNGVADVQILLAIDRSGSMSSSDPDSTVIKVAKNFLDSIAKTSPSSMVGVVLFSAKTVNMDSAENGAIGNAPLELNSAANLDSIKSWIDLAAVRGNATPYGAALDTCLAIFKRAPESKNRLIIFLSDGMPQLSGNVLTDPDTVYKNFISSGKYSELPPVHTVYLHTQSENVQAAHDTLLHLSAITGGIFTDVSNVSTLYTVFLDTLLNKTFKVIDVRDFELINTSIGVISPGKTVAVSGTQLVVTFDPIPLRNGPNVIHMVYNSTLSSSKQQQISKVVTIIRKTEGLTLTEQAAFDALFQNVCTLPSEVTLLDTEGKPVADGDKYGKDTDSIRVKLTRGPGNDTLIQTVTVTVVTASGDTEVITLTETGINTNEYYGAIPVIGGDLTSGNGVVEVNANDMIAVVYNNDDFYSGDGNYYDNSYDYAGIEGLLSNVKIINGTLSAMPAYFGLGVNIQNNLVRFSVSLKNAGEFNVSVFDINGRQVWNINETGRKAGIQNVDCSVKLHNGTYVAVLKTSNSKALRKFVIVR